jgi:hypothetical protein
MEFLKDLFQFIKQRKKFWLIPLILILVLLGVVVILSESSAVASLIYTLF